MRVKQATVLAPLLFLLGACASNEAASLASGAFESTEVVVSSEAMGKIVQLDVEEGETLRSGQLVARLECTPLLVEQLDDQLKRCSVSSPIDGTVLVKYAEVGELATVGKPLFKLADTKHMFLRAYITAEQLSTVKLGQEVKVQADLGADGFRDYSGHIAWISSKAEFTPKTIQTKSERANLVYAVRVAVQNDGYLKIGMYGTIPDPGHPPAK